MPVVLDAKHRLLDRVTPTGDRPGDSRRSHLTQLAGEIEWAKARRVAPAGYEEAARSAGRRLSRGAGEVAAVYEAYEAEKRRRGVVDLDDLLERLTDELLGDADFAAASRWRLRHFFVDELQDANPAQLALLDAWLGDSVDLFAVGDARQAIYGWNGADPEAMASFATVHPGTTTLALTANYRSTSEIVRAASALLGDRSTRAMRTAPGAHPTIRRYANDREEAEEVARAMADAHASGREWAQCAVLTRTNAQLATLSDACGRFAVPLRNAGRSYLDLPEVARLLAGIRTSNQTQAFRVWSESLIAAYGGGTGGDTSPKPSAAELLVGYVQEFVALEPVPTGAGLVTYLREATDPAGTREGGDGVDLLTFHRAKGLEWDAVWVVGLEEGFVPLAHASTAAQLAEERRLLYVALTRARDVLHCSWAAVRQMRGRPIDRRRSPFLDPIEGALTSLGASTFEPTQRARAGIAASRAALRRTRGG